MKFQEFISFYSKMSDSDKIIVSNKIRGLVGVSKSGKPYTVIPGAPNRMQIPASVKRLIEKSNDEILTFLKSTDGGNIGIREIIINYVEGDDLVKNDVLDDILKDQGKKNEDAISTNSVGSKQEEIPATPSDVKIELKPTHVDPHTIGVLSKEDKPKQRSKFGEENNYDEEYDDFGASEIPTVIPTPAKHVPKISKPKKPINHSIETIEHNIGTPFQQWSDADKKKIMDDLETYLEDDPET